MVSYLYQQARPSQVFSLSKFFSLHCSHNYFGTTFTMSLSNAERLAEHVQRRVERRQRAEAKIQHLSRTERRAVRRRRRRRRWRQRRLMRHVIDDEAEESSSEETEEGT